MCRAGDKGFLDDDRRTISPAATDCVEVKPAASPRAVPPFLIVGLKRKASPFIFNSWLRLLETADGRDKSIQVLLYISRFLGWYLSRKYHNQSIRFTELYNSVSHSRKAIRIGQSIVEFQKFCEIGLGNLILRYFKGIIQDRELRSTSYLENPTWTKNQANKSAASKEQTKHSTSAWSPSHYVNRSVGNSMLSMVPQLFGISVSGVEETTLDLVPAIGSAIKILGSIGFWLGDNIYYLSSTGALDNYTLPPRERLAKRKHVQTVANIRANQANFIGSLGGFVANLYAYIKFRRGKVSTAKEELRKCESKSQEEREETILELREVQVEEFSLFLSLLKSCCDIAVFSNQPGVDLHTKWRGKKNHEGLHCLFGLVSAATVIHSNFPNVD